MKYLHLHLLRGNTVGVDSSYGNNESDQYLQKLLICVVQIFMYYCGAFVLLEDGDSFSVNVTGA